MVIRGNHSWRQEWQYFRLKFQQAILLEVINSNMTDTDYVVWRKNIKNYEIFARSNKRKSL
jgi:hypothetical protein